MEFGLSEEQGLLQESVGRFLDERVPTSRVRQVAEEKTAFDERIWTGLADLGAVGCLVPESHGGSGLSLLDAAIVAQALGHGVTPAPFLGTSVLATLAFREAASDAQQATWLPKLASGERRIGVAITEWAVPRPDVTVGLRDGRLNGDAFFVLDGGAADAYLVACGSGDLCVVARDASGLEYRDMPTVDRTRRVGELHFEGTPVEERLGTQSRAAIERLLAAGRIILAADALGVCDRALALAVDYAGQRKQFGRVIGSYQAVKHMCAEMAAAIEPARSFLWYAAHAFDAAPEEVPSLACLAKASLTDVATDVVRRATEVHGGIGFTDEYDLHLWFKRAGLDRQLLGGPIGLRRRAAELQGLVAA